MTRRVLRARQVLVAGVLRPAAVVVEHGTILDVLPPDAPVADAEDVRVPDAHVLLPGLVDSHVHVNEPGRTEWEGFASATAAAAAGGVTTIVDMPLNSLPPTTTADAFGVKRAVAAPQARVDVAFWGGAVPENLGSLRPLHEAGVLGFKCFLAPSGVPEFGHLGADGLEAAAAEVAALGSRLIVHAEDPDLLAAPGALGPGYDAFLASRPPASESSAIGTVLAAARRTGARVHVLHLSDGGSLQLLREAKAGGVDVTVETCPHYLTLTAEEIPDGAAEFKCCPPIRDKSNRDLLWEGLLDGTIDAVVSDHSPSTVELKRAGDGDFGLAWGGVSGLQVGFSAVWTEARTRGVPLERVVALFTTGPAAVAGLTGLGEIATGAPAHLVELAPDEEFVVDAATLLHRNPVSAYDHRTLTGRVRRTWLRGEPVFDVDRGVVGDPAGRLLTAAATTSPAAAPATGQATTPAVPVLQPLAPGAEVPGDHYVPAGPGTVLWGRLPCAADAPVLTIDPGESVTFDTVSHEGILEDQGKDPVAWFGRHGVPREAVLDDAVEIAATLARDPHLDGPHVVTGPVHVTGARPGDLLRITVEKLDLRVPYGVISNRHGKGALAGELPRTPGNVSVFTPVAERAGALVGTLPVTEGGPRVVEFALAPFLGTMGVAVAGDERPHSVPPGAHGGNVDIRLLVEGSELYLPVQVDGALAYVGDPHFAQGDGEVALTALEGSLRATVRFDVVPRAQGIAEFGEVLGPLVRADGHLVPTGLDPDLDEAMRQAVRAAIRLIQGRWGLDEHLAYAYLSAATDFDVSQVVDVVCGVHARIREADFEGVDR